jgi:hypothetical protein
MMIMVLPQMATRFMVCIPIRSMFTQVVGGGFSTSHFQK